MLNSITEVSSITISTTKQSPIGIPMETIVAIATKELVVTGSAIKGVISGIAIEDIISGEANNLICGGCSREIVISLVADNNVHGCTIRVFKRDLIFERHKPVFNGELIAIRKLGNKVITLFDKGQIVLSNPGTKYNLIAETIVFDNVSAVTYVEEIGVVASPTFKDIISGTTSENVVACITIDDVISSIPKEDVIARSTRSKTVRIG